VSLKLIRSFESNSNEIFYLHFISLQIINRKNSNEKLSILRNRFCCVRFSDCFGQQDLIVSSLLEVNEIMVSMVINSQQFIVISIRAMTRKLRLD
jgi:hypothetical protein